MIFLVRLPAVVALGCGIVMVLLGMLSPVAPPFWRTWGRQGRWGGSPHRHCSAARPSA